MSYRRPAVVPAVEDPGVEAVLVDPEVEHAEAHLLRRAVGRRHWARPARGRDRSGAGERRLTGVSGGVVELEPEGGDERNVVEQLVASRTDEVRGDTSAGKEGSEVDRRSLDRRVAAAGPLDLGDLEAAPLGGLGDRLGLEDVGVERRGAVAKRLTVDVERVVGRAVDARPCAGREAVPAGAGVRGRLGQETASGRIRALLEEPLHRGHDASVGVLLDEILAEAVSREEDGLVRRRASVAVAVGGRSGRHRRRNQSGQERDDAQQDDGSDACVRRHGELLLDEPGARGRDRACGRGTADRFNGGAARSSPDRTLPLWKAHDNAASTGCHGS